MHFKNRNLAQSGFSRIEAHRTSMHALAESRLDRRLRTKIDPDDIVQEAMLRAYLGFDQLRAPQEPRVIYRWLRRIVCRVLSDQRKRFLTARRNIQLERHGLEPNSVGGAGCQSLTADHTPPSQVVIRAEEQTRLLARLEQLPQDMRVVMKLYYIESNPIMEIARITQRTPASIAGLLRRGNAKLRG